MVLIMEYDGTCYHGFQLQVALPTIQGEAERAIGKLTGERTRVGAASRTDAGVHARGQVVSFITDSLLPPRTFIKGMNYYLPEDIAVKAAYKVDKDFDVRRKAVSREYNYHILNSSVRSPLKRRFAYPVSGCLDIKAMNRACKCLLGKHDLASFVTNLGVTLKSTIRDVHRAEVKRKGELVIFDMAANSFLAHQVRNTVGSLIRIGLGKMNIDEFCSIMEAKTFGLAGPTAPARGLCLMRVNYASPFEEGDENL